MTDLNKLIDDFEAGRLTPNQLGLAESMCKSHADAWRNMAYVWGRVPFKADARFMSKLRSALAAIEALTTETTT